MRLRGKKIEMLRVTEGAQRHEVELRFDKEKGDFFAQLGGEWFSALTLDELKATLQAKAKMMVSYEYKWFIEIRMSVDRALQGHGRGRSDERGLVARYASVHGRLASGARARSHSMRAA